MGLPLKAATPTVCSNKAPVPVFDESFSGSSNRQSRVKLPPWPESPSQSRPNVLSDAVTIVWIDVAPSLQVV